MKSKYGNRKVVTAEGTFDSHKEYQCWLELRIMERAGLIKGLKRQVSYELIPAQYESYVRVSEKTGKPLRDGVKLVERACSYVADFVYTDCKTGDQVVLDTKGVRTEAYKIKKKLMLHVHGIRVTEI